MRCYILFVRQNHCIDDVVVVVAVTIVVFVDVVIVVVVIVDKDNETLRPVTDCIFA